VTRSYAPNTLEFILIEVSTARTCLCTREVNHISQREPSEWITLRTQITCKLALEAWTRTGLTLIPATIEPPRWALFDTSTSIQV
jgi:hypothetical protein